MEQAKPTFGWCASYRGMDLAYPDYELNLSCGLDISDHRTLVRAMKHLKSPKYTIAHRIINKIFDLEETHNIAVSLLVSDISQKYS